MQIHESQQEQQKMVVLVTGANGFVGRHALEALQQEPNVELIAAARDANKLPEWFRGEKRIGDLRDQAYLKRLVLGVDVVCHTAAWTSLWAHPEKSKQLHLEPTLDLIDQVLHSKVRRFIHTSTTSAAAPQNSQDPMSRGIKRAFWPHLSNVVQIENLLRSQASSKTTMVNLRLGIFAGAGYGLGILPILVPRLKTHLVPWVNRGKTSLPIVNGKDIGQAFAKAALAENLGNYESFNIVGPEVPTTGEVIEFLASEYHLPAPHFSVPFPIAYAFAWLMEKTNFLSPWEPLVTRSIVHLLEEVNADNRRAEQLLGYQPNVHWKKAVAEQMAEMQVRQTKPMSMAVPCVGQVN